MPVVTNTAHYYLLPDNKPYLSLEVCGGDRLKEGVFSVCVRGLRKKSLSLSRRFLDGFPGGVGPAAQTFTREKCGCSRALIFWEGLKKLAFCSVRCIRLPKITGRFLSLV